MARTRNDTPNPTVTHTNAQPDASPGHFRPLVSISGITRFALKNLTFVAALLLGMSYLGLALFLGTFSPFLLVQGTSMEPTLHAGDLLLSRKVPAREIRLGDVIAFSVPPDAQKRLKMPSRAAHRVIGIEGEGDRLKFVTQGDNSDVDPFMVPSSAVSSVLIGNLGPVGRPFLLLTDRAVLLTLGLPILTFALIILAVLWMAPGEARADDAPRKPPAGNTPHGDFENALGSLTSAVAEYGTHLMSHTAVVKNMAGSSEALHAAINQQNEVLADLAAVVKELRVQSRGDNGDLKAGAFGDGYENAPNGTELTLGLSPDGGPERPNRTVNHPSPKGQQERVKGETNVSTDPLRLALEGVLEYAGGRSL